MRFFFCLLSLVVLVACTPGPKLELDKVTSITVDYPQLPRPKDSVFPTSVKFEQGSDEVEQVKNWLENNKDGWSKYVVTEEKTLIQVFAFGFILHIQESSVAFEQGIGSGREMYSKPISKGEFDYLIKK